MPSPNVKIAKLYYAVDGTKEPFEWTFPGDFFEETTFTTSIKAKGELMRVEEGIVLLLEELKATQTAPCSCCGKSLKLPLQFHPSEWLFYEEKPLEDDASNELLSIDKHQMEIDIREPLRQELLLNMETVPRCKIPCKSFIVPDLESKPLSKLKDLL